jgi:hypothetical protein
VAGIVAQALQFLGRCCLLARLSRLLPSCHINLLQALASARRHFNASESFRFSQSQNPIANGKCGEIFPSPHWR